MSVSYTHLIHVDGEEVVVEKTKPGDFVVCNLASSTFIFPNVKDARLHTTKSVSYTHLVKTAL